MRKVLKKDKHGERQRERESQKERETVEMHRRGIHTLPARHSGCVPVSTQIWFLVQNLSEVSHSWTFPHRKPALSKGKLNFISQGPIPLISTSCFWHSLNKCVGILEEEGEEEREGGRKKRRPSLSLAYQPTSTLRSHHFGITFGLLYLGGVYFIKP